MNPHARNPSSGLRLPRLPLILSLCLAFTAGRDGGGAGAVEAPQSIDSIRRAAVSVVRARLGGPASPAVVTAGELDPRLRLGRCTRPLEASLPDAGEIRAEETVRVNCRSEGWSIYVSVRVEANLPVLVLQRPVAAGAHLGPDDVVAGTRRVAGILSEFVPDLAALGGRHVRRPLPAGTVLVAQMLEADPLVFRGQQVTLIAALGGIEVRAPGRVLTDAAAASRVQVQNLSSQRIVEGTVESAYTVRVTP
jgi:flagella basal body P-ring formation protein FlgA